MSKSRMKTTILVWNSDRRQWDEVKDGPHYKGFLVVKIVCAGNERYIHIAHELCFDQAVAYSERAKVKR